jgi:hypothetical protein
MQMIQPAAERHRDHRREAHGQQQEPRSQGVVAEQLVQVKRQEEKDGAKGEGEDERDDARVAQIATGEHRDVDQRIAEPSLDEDEANQQEHAAAQHEQEPG